MLHERGVASAKQLPPADTILYRHTVCTCFVFILLLFLVSAILSLARCAYYCSFCCKLISHSCSVPLSCIRRHHNAVSLCVITQSWSAPCGQNIKGMRPFRHTLLLCCCAVLLRFVSTLYIDGYVFRVFCHPLLFACRLVYIAICIDLFCEQSELRGTTRIFQSGHGTQPAVSWVPPTGLSGAGFLFVSVLLVAAFRFDSRFCNGFGRILCLLTLDLPPFGRSSCGSCWTAFTKNSNCP